MGTVNEMLIDQNTINELFEWLKMNNGREKFHTATAVTKKVGNWKALADEFSGEATNVDNGADDEKSFKLHYIAGDLLFTLIQHEDNDEDAREMAKRTAKHYARLLVLAEKVRKEDKLWMRTFANNRWRFCQGFVQVPTK